jgi:hypothetical protein
MTAREPKVQYVVTLEGAAGADTAHAHTLRYAEILAAIALAPLHRSAPA